MAEYFPIAGFLVLILGITASIASLKRKGIRVINRSRKATGRTGILSVVFLFILMLWIMELLQPLISYRISLLPEILTRPFLSSAFLRLTGMVMIFLAMILNVLSLIHFKQSLRFGLDETNTGKLVTTGVFSVTRNPFFLSLIIFFSGITMIYPTGFFLAFTGAAVAGIHRYILREEKFLVNVFGNKFRDYMKKTARYL